MKRALLSVRKQLVLARFGSITKKPASEVTPANAEFDEVTHTGQAWDQADYRLQRFDIAKKQVNPNIAMHLVQERPPQDCGDKRVIYCDGGDGGHPALGHPRIFINLVFVVKSKNCYPIRVKSIEAFRSQNRDKPGIHACGYCGNRFYNSHVTKGDDLSIQHLNC